MIQILIDAETHEELVAKLKGLASWFSNAPAMTEISQDTGSAPIPARPDTPETRAEDAAADRSQAAEAADVPNPTKATVALAEQLGVDLAQVTGSGKNGRVTQADVKRVAAQMQTGGPPTQEQEDGESETPAETPPTDPFGDAPEAPAADTLEPTKDNATAALKAVNAEHGMPKCVEILKQFNAQRIGDLEEQSYGPFIDECAGALDLDAEGIAARVAEAA